MIQCPASFGHGGEFTQPRSHLFYHLGEFLQFPKLVLPSPLQFLPVPPVNIKVAPTTDDEDDSQPQQSTTATAAAAAATMQGKGGEGGTAQRATQQPKLITKPNSAAEGHIYIEQDYYSLRT